MTTFGKITREMILELLKQVQEPVVNEDIVSLGLVREIGIEKDQIFLHLEATLEAPELQEELRDAIFRALQPLGTCQIKVHFSGKGQEAAQSTASSPIAGVRHVIAVASGKGGVGKSTVAVNLALALQGQGFRVGLMDGDIYGPNIPVMLGIPQGARPHATAEGKIVPLEAHGLKTVSIAYFVGADQPVIWRGPMLHKTVEQFLRGVDWGTLDYLVVDLPPGTGDVQLSLAQWVLLSGVVIVSTPQEVALADVRRAVNMFRQLEIPILGVVENMTGAVFGKGGGEKMAEVLQVPFLGDIPLEAQVRECGDSGIPVVRAHPQSPLHERFVRIAAGVRQALKEPSKEF